MNKEELEKKVNELETTLNSVELNAKVLKDDLKEANKKLANLSYILLKSMR
jgi:septal ring factor EnvC (AmiA/AmiB activator)